MVEIIALRASKILIRYRRSTIICGKCNEKVVEDIDELFVIDTSQLVLEASCSVIRKTCA